MIAVLYERGVRVLAPDLSPPSHLSVVDWAWWQGTWWSRDLPEERRKDTWHTLPWMFALLAKGRSRT
jgi:hypothetical protein